MTRLGVALAALLLAGCGLEQDVGVGGAGGGPEVGSAAPAVRIQTLGGGVVDLAAERGHPVVIDFFGSWCGPCRRQQADLNRVAVRYRPRGVVVVGDALRDDRAPLQGYLSGLGVPYPAGLDDGRVAAQFAVLAPPTTVVVDARGRVAANIIGGIHPDALSTLLDRLLTTG
ncbi:MAG TPA: TlpA disulfide reductase family protein [Candidatus Dormibacteraeota bacterium]|jgi:thiol-disulfide isomerase/thioredoxin